MNGCRHPLLPCSQKSYVLWKQLCKTASHLSPPLVKFGWFKTNSLFNFWWPEVWLKILAGFKVYSSSKDVRFVGVWMKDRMDILRNSEVPPPFAHKLCAKTETIKSTMVGLVGARSLPFGPNLAENTFLLGLFYIEIVSYLIGNMLCYICTF